MGAMPLTATTKGISDAALTQTPEEHTVPQKTTATAMETCVTARGLGETAAFAKTTNAKSLPDVERAPSTCSTRAANAATKIARTREFASTVTTDSAKVQRIGHLYPGTAAGQEVTATPMEKNGLSVVAPRVSARMDKSIVQEHALIPFHLHRTAEPTTNEGIASFHSATRE